MAVESTARRQPAENPPLFRSAPHNIEVEQALLGAILVNNDAFDRVSQLLAADHFFDARHQLIFETAARLIREGKVATPLTLKTFLEDKLAVEGFTPIQYLARLAAEATSIINAYDYGRVIYQLALRRPLI